MTDDIKGFDHGKAEIAADEIFSKLLGGIGPTMLESRTPGVIAFERLDVYDDAKVDWDKLAADLAEKVGLPVVCIANCDWSFDGKEDEEATLIAFDTPDLDDDYRDDHRNKLSSSSLRPR